MPQPLNKSVPLFFGPGVIQRRPDLAAQIADIANIWSQVETTQGMVLASMLRAESGLVVSLYTSLSGSTPRRAVFDAVADQKLTKDQLTKLEKIHKKTKTVAGQRNAVVHGFWHVSDEFPDALILRDPRDIAAQHAEGISAASAQRPLDWTKFNTNTLVYRKPDFEEVARNVTDVAGVWWDFLMEVQPKHLPQSDER